MTVVSLPTAVRRIGRLVSCVGLFLIGVALLLRSLMDDELYYYGLKDASSGANSSEVGVSPVSDLDVDYERVLTFV